MAFPTLAPLPNSPTPRAPTNIESKVPATTASTMAVATPFPPEPGCLPCVESLISLQPVPNSTSSDIAWQHAFVSHQTSHSSHSVAADHAGKALSKLPTAADTQGVSGQNSSILTGQLVRPPSPPGNFANWWWWSVPIINTLCTVLLVETSWTLATLLASIYIAKVTAAIHSSCHLHFTLLQLL